MKCHLLEIITIDKINTEDGKGERPNTSNAFICEKYSGGGLANLSYGGINRHDAKYN